MRDVCVLGDVEIMQQGTRGYNTHFQVLYAESFQVFRPEMPQQPFGGRFFGENPVFELEGEISVSEMFFEYFSLAAFEKNFFGLEVTQQFIDVIVVAFGRKELSRRNVEECDSARPVFPEMHAGQKVVFFVVEDIIVDRNAGRDQLGDTSFDQFLGEFRVFELFADGNPFSRANQFGKVSIECVMRESGQFDVLGRSVGPPCEGDTQYLRCGNGIVGKCFIEVPYPEKQYGIGMNGFHLDVLFHQRGFYHLFCHGNSCFDLLTKIVKGKSRKKGLFIFLCLIASCFRRKVNDDESLGLCRFVKSFIGELNRVYERYLPFFHSVFLLVSGFRDCYCLLRFVEAFLFASFQYAGYTPAYRFETEQLGRYFPAGHEACGGYVVVGGKPAGIGYTTLEKEIHRGYDETAVGIEVGQGEEVSGLGNNERGFFPYFAGDGFFGHLVEIGKAAREVESSPCRIFGAPAHENIALFVGNESHDGGFGIDVIYQPAIETTFRLDVVIDESLRSALRAETERFQKRCRAVHCFLLFSSDDFPAGCNIARYCFGSSSISSARSTIGSFLRLSQISPFW